MDAVAQKLISAMMQQFAGSGVSLDGAGRILLPDGLDVDRVHRFAELVLVDDFENPKRAFRELFAVVGVAPKAISALDQILGAGGELDMVAIRRHPLRIGAALPRMIEIPNLFQRFLIQGLALGDPACASLEAAVVSTRKGAATRLGCRAHWDAILDRPEEVGELSRAWREALV